MPVNYAAVTTSFSQSTGPIEVSEDKRYLKQLASEPGYALAPLKLDPSSSYHQLTVQLNLAKSPACTLGITSDPNWLTSVDQKANTIMLRTAYGYVHVNSRKPIA